MLTHVLFHAVIPYLCLPMCFSELAGQRLKEQVNAFVRLEKLGEGNAGKGETEDKFSTSRQETYKKAHCRTCLFFSSVRSSLHNHVPIYVYSRVWQIFKYIQIFIQFFIQIWVDIHLCQKITNYSDINLWVLKCENYCLYLNDSTIFNMKICYHHDGTPNTKRNNLFVLTMFHGRHLDGRQGQFLVLIFFYAQFI